MSCRWRRWRTASAFVMRIWEWAGCRHDQARGATYPACRCPQGKRRMTYFIQQLVTGLAVGGTYALVALGFVLYFGVLNILNIAHAQTLMLAPALIVVLMQAGVAWPLAVVAAVALTFVYSYLVYIVSMKPFTRPGREASYLAPFVASFGVSMLTENLASTFLGSQPL